ncbi:MAG: helix-turn-helix transcriptional regulator [Candidatus Borkfalkiaceae bacterium]|nr:helix-turn-helix transcriptional regulator [Christensenellaceae bacterium]
MGDSINSEMLRGHIDTIILLSLVDGDRDSNEIRSDIEKKSDNRYSVKQGTFYSAMKRLTKQNYIKEYRSSSSDGIRRKYYSLTEKGKRFLDKNREEWLQSKELIDGLIETPSEPVSRVVPTQKDEQPDEFEKFKELASDIGDFRIETREEEDDYLGRLGADVLSDLENELNALSDSAEEEITEENEQMDASSENVLFDAIEGENSSDQYGVIEDKSSWDSLSSEDFPDEISEKTEDISDDFTDISNGETISDEEDAEESDSPYVLLESVEENGSVDIEDSPSAPWDDGKEDGVLSEEIQEETESDVFDEDEIPSVEEIPDEEREIIDRDLIETQSELDKLSSLHSSDEEIRENTVSETKENFVRDEEDEYLLSVSADHDFSSPVYDDSAYRIVDENETDYNQQTSFSRISPEESTTDSDLSKENEERSEISAETDETVAAAEKQFCNPVDPEKAFQGINIIYNQPQEKLFTADDFNVAEGSDPLSGPDSAVNTVAEEIPEEEFTLSSPSVADAEIKVITENEKIEEQPIVIFASSGYDFPAPSEEKKQPDHQNLDSETVEKKAPPEPDFPRNVTVGEEDDVLYVEDGKPASQREYKTVLSRLFPKAEEKAVAEEPVKHEEIGQPDEGTTPPAVPVDLDAYFERATRRHYEDHYRNYGEPTQSNEVPDEVSHTEEKISREEESVRTVKKEIYVSGDESSSDRYKTADKEESSEGKSDFSDLYAMANREGFKIRTSSSTDRFSGKYVLNNKLNFHTAWLFFLLLFGEMFLMNYAFADDVGWNWTVKGVLIALAALVPVIMTLRYIVGRKTKVTEIAPFRSAMEVSLIITFQIIIIILAVSLFCSVDFNSYSQVLSFVLIPSIFALNVPVYFILKYLLLESGKYFTK